MSEDKNQVFVAKQDQLRYEVLSDCGDVSLPINYRWGISRNGPYHSFNFEQLGEGITQVNHPHTTTDGERGESNFRCIGTYEFESPFSNTIAQICMEVRSGNVSILANDRRLEFLNSSIPQLAQSFGLFQELQDSVAATSPNTRHTQPIWKKFEAKMRACDVAVFENLDSFWGTLIGEVLEDEL